ncbi:Piso0_000683 [Millerozyma farinosa CBS 7064]|uniref:Piso0_000683 protein n=1 Tax=Pichia sorbitophila (strain ATCC MYA-4447 / BCRC 22081 / CBS 7064 / NBRC 10061 / NRRL Y-12695) TaxID=559304 RepID=G8YPS2_PICSO|nr:Piso0_000683 [Millerozyma farinosa CBS 7064]
MLALGDSILRIVNFVFLVIALGLTGSLAATTISQSNPQVNFAVFAAAFGILTSSFYGILAYFLDAFAWPVVLALFDFLNFVFTFAGATALAAGIRCHSCLNKGYLKDNSIAQGSTGRCRKAQASVAFLYFSVFIFLFSGVFSVISLFKGGLFGTSGRASTSRVGVPSMSQV